jgi:hypothetical protein
LDAVESCVKNENAIAWIQAKAFDIISRIIRLTLSLDEEIIKPDNLVETVNNITLIDYQSGYITISVLDHNSVEIQIFYL